MQAVLTASRTGQISMFGDLPNGTSPSYVARAAVSLWRHTFSEVGGDFDPDVDATRDQVVFSSTRHHLRPAIYMKNVNGVAVTQLTSDPASDIHPALSPDGTRVAFASDRAGSWDIWIMSVGGGPPLQISGDDADEVHPSWSPDGTQLVFSRLSAISGQWELWTAAATAGGTRRFIGYGLFPEWSPVSDTIVYQRAREQGSRWFSIWTLTLVDGEPQYPMELAASATVAMILPSWSFDGRRIAYSTVTMPPARSVQRPAVADGGPVDIWVMSSDGSSKVRLTDGHSRNFSPTFSFDGRVYFTSDRSGFENVWSVQPPQSDMGFSAKNPKATGGGSVVGAMEGGRAHTVSARDNL